MIVQHNAKLGSAGSKNKVGCADIRNYILFKYRLFVMLTAITRVEKDEITI
jgi:hypothetical protein